MNQQAPITYALDEQLVQAVIRNLEQQPAGQSRHLLNALESECVRQNQERLQAANEKHREEIRAELKTELQKKLDETSQAPAQADTPAT